MPPGLKHVALMANPKTAAYDYFLRIVEAAAPSLGIAIVASRIESAPDIERHRVGRTWRGWWSGAAT